MPISLSTKQIESQEQGVRGVAKKIISTCFLASSWRWATPNAIRDIQCDTQHAKALRVDETRYQMRTNGSFALTRIATPSFAVARLTTIRRRRCVSLEIRRVHDKILLHTGTQDARQGAAIDSPT